MQYVTLATESHSEDLRNFEGAMHFSIGAPWHTDRVYRRFRFRVMNHGSSNGRITILDGEDTILDVEEELMEAPFQLDFTDEHWSSYTHEQKEMIRLLLAGAQQGVYSHWGLFSSSTLRALRDRITKSDIRDVKFAA